MKSLCLFIAGLLLLPVPQALGEERQSHAEIRKVAEAFIRSQTTDFPGTVEVRVKDLDRRIVRPACQKLEAFLPAGAKLLGNSTVGIRCPGKKGWNLFVPVLIKSNVDMLVSSRPLHRGDTLRAEDLATQRGELAQLDILTDPNLAVGKILKTSIGAGQVLRQTMLREPYAITQGQVVHLRAAGTGFSVQTAGNALNNAAEGEAVRVKTPSGKVVSGIARAEGIVEVRP